MGSSTRGHQDDSAVPNVPVRDGEEPEPQALVVSYWFDPGHEGEGYAATLRLTGRRVGAAGRPSTTDTFVHEETIDHVVPGSGPVSLSSWVYGIEPGDWDVVGELIRPPDRLAPTVTGTRRRHSTEPLARAHWSSRRWSLATGPTVPVRTRWALLAPLARIPGVIPGSFTLLGVLGIVAALVVQSALLAPMNVALNASLAVSLLAVASGLLAAKLWSRFLHPGEKIIGPGWAVDGFLIGAPTMAVAALLAAGLPVGVFLDASAPGIFFAVAIGRIGCFFTGCCAGQPTSSRWGVWSSDRRVGARRIPTQLLESATGLLIGLTATTLVVGEVIPFSGGVFVASIAGYFGARQILLRLRADRREFLWRRASSTKTGSAIPSIDM